MNALFAKLNLKDHREIVIINGPPSFEPEIRSLTGVNVIRDLEKVKALKFAIVFAIRQCEVDRLSIILAEKALDDIVLWFAYPKGSSKRYKCDFNRDNGWKILRSMGYDTVRAVAIDEDWAALRLRRLEFIKLGKK